MDDPESEAEHAFAEAAFQRLAVAAEPILKRKMEALGATDPKSLGLDKARALFRESILEAAAATNPNADFDMLRRSTAALTNDRFLAAMQACRKASESTHHGAFDPAQGIDAGILLAGFGLPVLPLDRKTLRPLTDQTATTIEEAEASFGRFKTAFVGFDAARAPFHVVVTDCVLTLQRLLRTDPAFASLRAVMERDARGLPTITVPAFRHGAMLVAKHPEDRISTYLHDDPHADRGSVLVIGGWVEDDLVFGAPNDGLSFVPQQLLEQMLIDPRVIGWLNKPEEGHVISLQ